MVIRIDLFCWKNSDSEHISGYMRIFSWLNGQKKSKWPTQIAQSLITVFHWKFLSPKAE